MYVAMRIYVTPQQYAFLHERSSSTGQAMARLVRTALDQAYPIGDAQVDPGSDLRGSPRPVQRAVAPGTDPSMDAKRYAQAGLVGVRGKAGARLAEAVARRTRLSADTLKTFVGVYLIVSRIRSFVKMAQRARRTRD
jgi:hypothetical protein